MNTCRKCGYEWLSRTLGTPKECPQCRSRRWNVTSAIDCPHCVLCPAHGKPVEPIPSRRPAQGKTEETLRKPGLSDAEVDRLFGSGGNDDENTR